MATKTQTNNDRLTTLNVTQFAAVELLLANSTPGPNGSANVEIDFAEEHIENEVLDDLFRTGILGSNDIVYNLHEVTVAAMNDLKVPAKPKPGIIELTTMNSAQFAVATDMVKIGIPQANNGVLIPKDLIKHYSSTVISELLEIGILKDSKPGFVLHPATAQAIRNTVTL
jgi:hypothetical protein